jgi:hypothetical protein
MKYLFLFLLLPVLGQAQIKMNRVQFTSDSTVVLQDTTYWEFSQDSGMFMGKFVPLYQADLIVIRGGQISIPKSIGPSPKGLYLQGLRDERDSNTNEAVIVRQALDRINERRIKIAAEITKVAK